MQTGHRSFQTWLCSGGALALTVAAASPLIAQASEYKVAKGADVSARARARSVDLDLRDLPLVKDWQPGDPIKEIPRRHHGKPAFEALADATAEPQEDPLLAIQEAAPPVSVLAFTSPILNFAGQGFSGVNPPDTVGDVGPGHYVQSINHSNGAAVTVYSKTNGAVLAGPFYMDSLGTGDCATGLGDPVVLYDGLADRWLLSEFSNSGNKLCVYVSKTANPVSGGWWAYAFQAPGFPDYPKYGVWPDAYYASSNESSPAVYALDRQKMLLGQTATFQRFTASSLAGFSFQALTPADLDGATAPPSGASAIFARHRDDEVHNAGSNNTSQDYLDLYQFHVDWTTPANSTFSGPTSLAVAEFDSSLCGLTSFNCFPQPGSSTTLDPLREVVMFRLAYRNFGGYASLVGNFVTDVNGADRGGIRWFELRKTGTAAWTVQQQGTYSPDATNRWMGSIAQDQAGNIALGYSVSASSSVYPGIRYAGRLASDPTGTLPQGEVTLVSGSAANGSNRWGDYSAMSIDPADNCTFWFTTEYSPASSWATRIGSFKFDSCGTTTPDFSLACSPASLTVQQGTSGTSTCTVTSTGGFNSAVSLACASLPAGVSCSYSPASVTPPANGTVNSTLTVSVSGSAAVGTSTIQAQGVSGSTTRSSNLSLTVTATPTPDFGVSCAPSSLSIQQGNSGASTCTVSSSGGFASAVSLACATLPAGVTCGFSPASVTPPANGSVTSALTVSVSASAAIGTSSFQVQGVSGSTTKTFNMSLTVTGTGGDLTAVYDATLKAPKCGTVGKSCDSSTLLNGRDGKGPEPNQPNTINTSCADGTSGTYHSDESNDRIKVLTTDGSTFATGKTVRVEATVWAWTTPSSDKLDLYYAANASSPTWTLIGTLTPTAAGAQTLSATYTLPTGALQAVRARFRYQGSAAACGTGSYDDHDDLVFAVTSGTTPPDVTAVYDATLKAPKCATVGKACDSSTLLNGRDGKGPEPNQPNTINTSCADGTSGTYHSDESNDRIKVLTTDGSALAAGKTVRVEATVWAYSSFSSDHLDLYYTANAASPSWTLIGTLTPAGAGVQVLSATYTLPAGTLQAVRARFRYNGSASACTTGSYDDHDDLVFAVQ